MQDSDDDYFDNDGFVYNEEVIALLDAEENKFKQSQRLTQPVHLYLDDRPPAKRKKLFHEHEDQPQLPTRQNSINELPLPDVSLQSSQAYGTGSRRRASGSNWSVGGHSASSRGASPYPHQLPHAARQGPSVNVRRSVTPRTASGQQYGVPSKRASSSSATSVAQNTTHIPRDEGAPLRAAPNRASFSSTSSSTQTTRVIQDDGATLRAELEALRAQLKELMAERDKTHEEMDKTRQEMEITKEESEKAHQEYHTERDARLAKEGEVSILRSRERKAREDYAAALARIKAAKEEAEAAQAQAEQSMKAELDRLKSEYQFKQHEMESSTRSLSRSARSKRISDQPPRTPVQMPSQMREWNASAGSSSTPRTPSRRMVSFIDSPEVARRRKSDFETPKKSAMLPGFVNAFSPSSLKASQNSHWKGKQRESSRVEKDTTHAPPHPSSHQHEDNQCSSPLSSPTPSNRSIGSQALGPDDQQDDNFDADMDDEVMADVKDDAPTEEYDVVEPPDRRAELQRIIFTHKLSSSALLTFHFLLSSPLPDSASAEKLQSYAALCDRLLENLVNILKLDDVDYLNEVLSDIIIQMAEVLCDVRAIPALASLFALIREIILRQRTFARLFLSHCHSTGAEDDDDDGAGPAILAVLCNVVRKCLTPQKEPWGEDLSSLGLHTLRLLEMLAWSAPEDLAMRLSFITKNPKVLMILVSTSQPSWLLHRTARLFAFLASHECLFRHLLVYAPLQPDEEANRPSRIIDHLTFFLTDMTRQGPEADSLREAVLIFVAGLVVAHPSVKNTLGESETLIPSIVLFLYNLTTPVYEEEEELMNTPELIPPICEKINRTVSLLHTIAHGSANLDLKSILVNIRFRQFHGILHMYHVALGRVSYADIPGWFDASSRYNLEQVMDLARELLEIVSEGNELEHIWCAFNSDDEPAQSEVVEPKQDDDEEKQAQLLHATNPVADADADAEEY